MSRWPLMIVGLLLLSGCSESTDSTMSPPSDGHESSATEVPDSSSVRRLTARHLPNLVRIHPQVYSGGLPAGDAAFAELQVLGIKTLISVDAAAPDVAAARRHGLRYVHLPHGYDGIPQQRARELAKAVHELQGPLYIHCHHGKHRSPAAASVACVMSGLLDSTRARHVLEVAGTSFHYRGLYQSAVDARPLEAALLAALNVKFQERAEVPPMAEAMVALEQTHDHLQQIAAAGWSVPAGQPDLDPAHEALLLREHLTELLRTVEVQQQPDEFRRLLEASSQAAEDLERGLRAWNATSAEGDASPEAFDVLAGQIAANCSRCHQLFRDVPLSEKPAPHVRPR